VWSGGVDKQRLALLGSTDETDLFRNGSDLWQWTSGDQVAVHATVPAAAESGGAAASPTPLPGAAASSLTPAALASRALGALDASTRVVVESGHTVAHRSAYELVLTPRTSGTKVGSVRISVDGATKVPLGVQVFARHSISPAVDVAFTSIRFARPSDRNFVFTPPANATVHQVNAASAAKASPGRTGADWTTVIGLSPGTSMVSSLERGLLLKTLTPVSGRWGKGHLLESSLISVLVTDDGRLFVGAVDPADLYAAAATK
jgi:hypothetical protein